MEHEATATLIEDIHGAGLEPERWAETVASTTRYLGATAAGLFLYEPGAPQWNFHANVGVDPAWLARFQGDFTLHDNPCEVRMRPKPLGTVAADWMLGPLSEVRDGTRLNHEWAAPQGLRSAAIVKVASGKDSVGLLSLIRTPQQGEWLSTDVARIRGLAPHFVRALRVSSKLGALRGRADFAEALVAATDEAIFVTRADGRISYANPAGERLLLSKDGLSSDAGVLAAATTHDSRRMLELVGSAACAVATRGGTLSLPRPSGRPALRVRVVSGNPRLKTPVSVEWQAIVFVSEPVTTPSEELEARLCQRYGLTRTEAHWATQLATTPMRLREAAELFGVSLNTAKTHLKRIYDKTGARSRGHLVKLVTEPPLAR